MTRKAKKNKKNSSKNKPEKAQIKSTGAAAIESSQIVYNSEPVAFTFEYPLMISPAQYLSSKIKRVDAPNKTDDLDTVKSIVKKCFNNMSIIANAIMNKQRRIVKEDKEQYVELLQCIVKSPSIKAATRSYAAAQLVNLKQKEYVKFINNRFPLSKNNEKLAEYRTWALLVNEFFEFHQIIHRAVEHTYSTMPQSEALIEFYNSILDNAILDPKTHALACAKLLHWGYEDESGKVQAKIDEVESRPDVESQLCGVFSQSYLTDKKVEMWTSDRVKNSKSALVQLIGGVYKTYDENADPALADELAAIWAKLDTEQQGWFFRILFEHPKTEVFKQFLNKACEAIESEEVFDQSRDTWSIWGVDPSPKLLERYGWNKD